jgi:PAS domain S-box-containing protein
MKDPKELNSRILERIPALVCIYNTQTGVYTYVNDIITGILGYTPDDFLTGGIPFVIDILHPADLEGLLAQNKKALERANDKKFAKEMDTTIAPFEFRIKQKSGRYVWLHTDGKVFDRDEKGKVLHIINVSVDITERKEAEIFAEKQKDEFIGIASHELKTPVTSIKAYIQLLSKQVAKAKDEKTFLILSKVDGQVNKLIHLITDLLDATKIEAGKMSFSESYFDFNELVREIVENLQRITPKHTLSLDLGYARTIRGDRERIGQVITNFITNAVKYSPNKDKVNIKSWSDKDMIFFSVQDFGIGIDKEKQKNLFKRFYRVTDQYERSFPGLGLGLYIALEIAKYHGGTIIVESEKGKGSTFTFSMPVEKVQEKKV